MVNKPIIAGRVLVIDDEEDIRKVLAKRLSDLGYTVFTAVGGKEGIEQAKELLPDLILLDIMMPEVDGIKVKEKLEQEPLTRAIPVIFLTALGTVADKIAGLNAGADDYITKPIIPEEFIARINSVLRRRKFYENISMTDGLTRVYNRLFLEKQLSTFCAMAKRYQYVFSIIMVDIDKLKAINDIYGHAAGDFAIKKTAEILKEILRDADIITRYGGDEFVIILPQSNAEQTNLTLKRLTDTFAAKKILWGKPGKELNLSISLGFATYNDNIDSEAQLLKAADNALYENKKLKK
jgi:diguanylate cyclase (GGDEF)-like protein